MFGLLPRIINTDYETFAQPCPPFSVASENYYKPEPGEPYRPLLAIPSQVRDMVPWFQYCTDLWFTGFDPPRSLVPAAALAPAVTTSDSVAPTIGPQPSASHDPGAMKTAAVWNPMPFPSPVQHGPLAKETNPIPVTKQQVSQPQPTGGDPGMNHQQMSQQDSGLTDPSEQSRVHSGNIGGPELPGDSGQDAPKVTSSPAQNQVINPAQVATQSVAQNGPQNERLDPGDLTPTYDATLPHTTLSLASHAVVADPSGVQVDGVKVDPHQAPASISGVAAINQGDSIVVASHIFHLPDPTEQAATAIAGQAVVPVANGVSIQGAYVTGTNPVIISGTTMSVDNSHLYIGSKAYPLPTASPASVTTLANGAVILPMPNAVSIYGTTLTAGAPAATFLRTAISLDASSNLIFDGTAQSLPSFAQTTADWDKVTTTNSLVIKLLPSGISVAGTTLTPGAHAITAFGKPVYLGSTILAIGTSSIPVLFGNWQSLTTTIRGQAITAAATGVEMGNGKLLPGAQGTTLGGTLVSLGSSGNLVVGSTTLVLGGLSGSLGGLIMGGLGPGAPSAKNISPLGSIPTSLSNSTGFGVHAFEGMAECLRNLVPGTLAALAVAIHLYLV